jgi:hypothetical protein
MKRLLLLLLEISLIVSVGLVVYFNYRDKGKTKTYHKLVIRDGKLHFLNPELEDRLTFYLTRQLGVYEGSFEIVDVVNLGTREITGVGYVLVTVKAPNGRLCQITLSKNLYPWAQWEIAAQNTRVQEAPRSLLPEPGKDMQCMAELGITPQEVREYYLKHPELTWEETEATFLDKETGMHILPADWKQIASAKPRFSLEISKDKSFRFVSSMVTESTYNSYWKVDYPTAYSGPGYRAYLYDKAEGSRK